MPQLLRAKVSSVSPAARKKISVIALKFSRYAAPSSSGSVKTTWKCAASGSSAQTASAHLACRAPRQSGQCRLPQERGATSMWPQSPHASASLPRTSVLQCAMRLSTEYCLSPSPPGQRSRFSNSSLLSVAPSLPTYPSMSYPYLMGPITLQLNTYNL